MTFGFSKSPFFAHFQAILIFETKKVIIWFHFETFIELFITNFDIFCINISLPDTLTMRMKLQFQGIGEVILPSIVKLNLVTMLKVLKVFVMGKPEENEVPISPIIHELHLPPLPMVLVHVYFHMNTKERHIMNVLRRFLDMMKIIGVQ